MKGLINMSLLHVIETSHGQQKSKKKNAIKNYIPLWLPGYVNKTKKSPKYSSKKHLMYGVIFKVALKPCYFLPEKLFFLIIINK